ncbi:MAG: hypothetical protein ACPLRX_06900 [Candidatus Saccharicenans sp.]
MARKQTILLFVAIAMLTSFAFSIPFGLNEESIHLTKGTKVESSGDVIRFITPDRTIEVTGSGSQLKINAYDKRNQTLFSGKQGQLIFVLKASDLGIQEVTPDDIILLSFKGLSPQPDPPGKILSLKSGTKIARDRGNLIFTTDNGTRFIFTPEPNGVTGKCQAYDSANKLLFTRANVGLARMLDPQSLKNKGTIQDNQTWLIIRSDAKEK